MDNRTYRNCVRVIITKGNLVLLGRKYKDGNLLCYEFPGGGVEEDSSFEETVVKECLEEIGILVKDIVSLNLKYKYELAYPNPKRAKLYRGGEDNWFVCKYDKQDKSLYNDDKDAMPYSWVTIDQAIKLISEGPESSFNSIRIKALLKLTEHSNKIIVNW